MAKGSFETIPLNATYVGKLVGGYNGYASADVLGPNQWILASNVFAGLFQAIRRARFANVVLAGTTTGYSAQGVPFRSLYHFRDPTPNDLTLGDVNNKLFTFNMASSYAATQRFNPYIDPAGTGDPRISGPWMRAKMNNQCFEHNGQLKQRSFGPLLTSITGHGLDTPDASPQVVINSTTPVATIAAAPGGASRTSGVTTITTTANHGFTIGELVTITGVTDTSFNVVGALIVNPVTATTFTYNQPNLPNGTSGSGSAFIGLQKTIGRSYAYAWEDALVPHVSAPSPATLYVAGPPNQPGQPNSITSINVNAFEVGTITNAALSLTVTGVGTAFSTAWVGRSIWANGSPNGGPIGRIASVQSATQLTLAAASIHNPTGANFQIYDPRATHLRWYATADGGATYFRIGRTVFNPSVQLVSGAGLSFFDQDNSEPPNGEFTNEISQLFNVPPPVGTFLQEYQTRIIVYGAPGFLQSFFYSNIELTSIGNLPESYAPLNQVTLPIGDGQLNGMSALPTSLIIWSNKSDMFKMTGVLSDNSISSDVQLSTTITRLPFEIGNASPYATKVTPLGVMWLTPDRKVMLYNDQYAPRDVGIPIQDILNSITVGKLSDARACYLQTNIHSWYVLAINTRGGPANDKLAILDLDILKSNGQASFFTFDMASNAPAWYLFDLACGDTIAAFDNTNTRQLLCAGTDAIIDADYNPPDFFISPELNVTATVTLHAYGNDTPEQIKTLEYLRYVTNRTAAQFLTDGWTFGINSIDDDVFTLQNPSVKTITPGIDSPLLMNWNLGVAAAGFNLVTQSPSRFSPMLFKFKGSRFVQGNRMQFQINFPSTPGAFELKGIHIGTRMLPPR